MSPRAREAYFEVPDTRYKEACRKAKRDGKTLCVNGFFSYRRHSGKIFLTQENVSYTANNKKEALVNSINDSV